MRKLLFFLVLMFGGAFLLKGNVSITSDSQLRVASWTFPIPAAIQNSPVMGYVNTVLLGRLGPNEASARPGTPTPPPLPMVNTPTGTFNANQPNTGRPQGTDPFDDATKALRGSR